MLIYITVLFFFIPTVHLTYSFEEGSGSGYERLSTEDSVDSIMSLTLSHKQDLQKLLPYLSVFRCMIVYRILFVI